MFKNSNENIDELKPIEPLRREKTWALGKKFNEKMTKPDAKVGTVRYQYALMAMLVTTGNGYMIHVFMHEFLCNIWYFWAKTHEVASAYGIHRLKF